MERDGDRVRLLIPEITPRVASKWITMWMMSGKTLMDFAQSSRERMKRENSELYKLLEQFGEEATLGGSLGYFLLRVQAVRGSVKIPIVTQEGIKSRIESQFTMAAIHEGLDFTDQADLDRMEELAQRTESVSPQQDMDSDERYFRILAEVIMSSGNIEEERRTRIIFGAVVTHDLLRHQAEVNKASDLLNR